MMGEQTREGGGTTMPGRDQEPGSYYVGVDVGTGSVRAALVDQRGILLAFADQPINQWEPQFNHHEQSSEDIWAACCVVTKQVVQGIDVNQIRGLGFDATCSLVVLDKQFRPLPVNHEGDPRRNIIMWLDHRAVSQVHRINETKHSVLRCVGGVMSVEMQAPKLLWLKENLRETCWDKAGHFFDLPDFLSWKATGVSARSLCSVVCKWTYSAEKGWDDSFWKMIGLEDFVADNYSKIAPVPPCTARLASPVFLGFCSRCCLCWEIYLQSSRSPSQLLPRRCPRVPHLAHPPPVRNLLLRKIIPLLFVKLGDEGNQVLPPGASLGHGLTPEAAKDLGLPAGIAVAASLIDAHAGGLGVIGADVRGYGLACEGQPMTSRLAVICGTSSCHMGISKDPIFVPGVWGPYFSAMVPGFWLNEGGQSVTGKLVTGLKLSQDLDDLAILYLATVQAIAFGTRLIIEAMEAAGHSISTLFLCGGLSKNPLFVQMHADITGMPVVLSQEVESVLVGAAILGACASGDFASVQEAMARMSKVGKVVLPRLEDKRYYDKKYQVFLKLVEHQKEYAAIMKGD
ncbi:FGGY carbohydrate kinase domain-containing protein isoform X6 [Mirounga angustirostris]|uniref:FGGY carbohydrate kinase domain-containing protein isoform X6 n=1 Tax=Mirounga angustirostris TaxID=9716 RepID=UPI001E685E2D|nr:FGGY carbohydrate kinase domain-containing protein isoform X6 [Mirounga angustirostris]